MKGMLQGATALAALVAASPAFATEGWYGRIDLGYSFDANGDLSGSDLTDPLPFDPEVDPDLLALDRFIPGNRGDLDEDWLQSIGIGYAFLNSGFRLEGEIAHRYNESEDDFIDFFDPDPFFIDPFVTLGRDKWHVWSYMANGYYDFNKGGQWEPYLGAGIGVDQVVVSHAGFVASVADISVDTPTSGTVVSGSGFQVNDDDWAFAWQLMAGVAFRATDQLMIDVGYRYHQTDGAEVEGVVFEDTFAGTPQEFFVQDADYDQSAILVGLRWQFAPPEPPPAPYTPPPPPACPAEQYTAERGKDLAAAMDAAAAQSRTCNYTGVMVTGPDSQLPAVRDGLVQRGVPASMINTQPSGAATGPVTITLN